MGIKNFVLNLSLVGKLFQRINNPFSIILDMLSMKSKNYMIYLKNGIKIKVRPSTSDRGIVKEIFLMDEYSKCIPFIKKANYCIDIGAQIGCFSLYAMKVNPRLKKVLSFEPASSNYKLLQENISLNGLETKIIPFNHAISDKRGKSKLFLSDKNSGGHSLIFKTGNSETVNVESINSVFKENKLEDNIFVKLDCEGAEYEIVLGMKENYFKKVNAIIMEYHDKSKLKEIMQKLSSNGFHLELDKKYSVLLAYKL